ncbi:hypothetical protein PLIIFM63780_006869 [Purpureocillium lilacinum]|uniref:uncharacterized protein n=1 Tax=Purpureocillium lilacinum TaxID=33203 RepID=UPI00208D3BA7|nr:hypothetical protein PLICBS_006880 [Purpureocillium lilacinum]GJN83320.1 hypothetical protein PLIIFM63780_006869 [Purpureocillium lilacinum]
MLGHRTRDAHQGRRDKPARKRTSPQSMTMMRRQRDYERCIAQQRARGRPLNGRWRCGDAWCMLPACRRDDAPTRAVRDRDRSRDGLWVDDVWRNFARDVAESIWPGEDLRTLGSQLGASRQRAVEALAASPEVRLAFVRFKELCRPGRLEPSRGQLRELLASLLPRLHDEYKREGASSASSTVYENGDWASDRHAGARGGDEDPGLRGAAMHFLLQVEAWPRSQQQRRLRDWSFGGRSAEGLAAVLLQLWALDDEACLETEEAVDEQRWTELWGEWLQQHPPLPEAEAEGFFGEVMKGIGAAHVATPWEPTKAWAAVAADLLKPILAVSIVGLAVKTYADVAGRRRDARLLAAERDAAEQQRRNNDLMDVYGDRSSLEALEKAVEFYEKRR